MYYVLPAIPNKENRSDFEITITCVCVQHASFVQQKELGSNSRKDSFLYKKLSIRKMIPYNVQEIGRKTKNILRMLLPKDFPS